jgi:hypothetical protein
VDPGTECREERLRRRVGEERGPRGVGRGKPDVDDDDVAGIIASQQVSAAIPAEGHGETCLQGPVLHAVAEVEAARSIDGDDRQFDFGEPVEQGARRSARRPRCPGTEDRVDQEAGGGPRSIDRDFAYAVRARPHRHRCRGAVRPGRRQRGDPDRDAEPVQGAGDDPAVTAVVPGTRGDDHPLTQPRTEAIGENVHDRTARRFHQGFKGDARSLSPLIPLRCL